MIITSHKIIKSKSNELSPSAGFAVQAIEYAEGCPIYLHAYKLGIWFAESIGMFRAQDLALRVSLLPYFFSSSPWGGKRRPQHVGG